MAFGFCVGNSVAKKTDIIPLLLNSMPILLTLTLHGVHFPGSTSIRDQKFKASLLKISNSSSGAKGISMLEHGGKEKGT